MDKKTTGIVAYLTFIGQIIAFVAGDKEGAKFHLNQALVIFLFYIVACGVSRIPFVGGIIALVGIVFLFVCWVIGLVAAINEEEKEVPLIGQIHLLK